MSFLDTTKANYEFEGKDGKKYFLSPLTLKDLGNFASWVKFRDYREALQADLPKSALDTILNRCLTLKDVVEINGEKIEKDFDFTSVPVRNALSSAAGLEKLLCVSLAKKHGEINLDTVLPVGEFSTLSRILLTISGLLSAEEKLDVEGNPEKN